jgi:glycopeptide antibiotics resistance protein
VHQAKVISREKHRADMDAAIACFDNQSLSDQEARGSASAFKVFCAIVFVVYVAVLVYLCFFWERVRTPAEYYQYNLVPFRVIRNYIASWNWQPHWVFYSNVIGNILVFMPFGALVPYLFAKFDRWYILFIAALSFSLAIETVQLITKFGTFDVDDLFLNTLGGMLGFFAYRIINLLVYAKQTPS